MAQTNVQAFSGDVAISSNLAVDTNTLFVDSVGNKVGIGTNAPGAPLEVHGADLTGEPVGTTSLISRHVGGGDGVLNIFGVMATSGEETLGLQTQIDGRAWQADIDGGWSTGPDSRYDLALQPYKGNVGIGTTNPGSALDVVGTVTATAFVGKTVGTHYGTISGSNAAAVSSLTATGNVGIGTNDPQGKLEISADFDHTLERPSSDQNHYLVLEKTGNKVFGTGPGISFVGAYHTTGAYPTNYAVIKGVSDLTSGEGRYGRLEFYTNSHASTAADKLGMVINHAGNVGIGTTNPQQILHLQTDTNYDGITLRDSTRELLKIAKGNNGSYINMFESSVSKVNISTGGDTYFTGGNVAIGTTQPFRALDVSTTGSIAFGSDVAQVTERGLYWSSDSDYAIYRTNGGWSSPDYQQLLLKWSTGIVLQTARGTHGRSFVGVDDRMSIGSSYYTTKSPTDGLIVQGNVGIGVAGPIAKLDVTYTEGVLADFSYSNTSTWHNKGIRATGGTGGFIYGHDINHSIFMRTSPKSTGDHNAYISPAAHKFYTGALMGLAGLDIRANINNTGLQVTGTITATSSITPNSDDRIKYNEEDVLNPLTLINQLNPQKYEKIIDTIDKEGTWIPTDEEWESVKSEYTYVDEFGFIAQDVRKIPELAFLVIGEETTDVLHTISSQIHSN